MISFKTSLILTFSLSLSLSSFATADDDDRYRARQVEESFSIDFGDDFGEDDFGGDDFGGDVFGDPHFKTWSGESYDFHGVCDLVLLKNPNFAEDLGMDVHIRSKKMNKLFTFVESASVKIGADILEVKGGRGSVEQSSWVNGVANTEDATVNLSGKYPVLIEDLNENSRKYTVKLEGDEAIVLQTWYSMLRVHFQNAKSKDFNESLGLMGAFPTGKMMARDGITYVSDVNKFGLEWQVLPTEPKLFREAGAERCEIPSSVEMRRRLGEISMTELEAEQACSEVEPSFFDMCVFDILVSNDKNMVGAY